MDQMPDTQHRPQPVLRDSRAAQEEGRRQELVKRRRRIRISLRCLFAYSSLPRSGISSNLTFLSFSLV